MSSSDAHNLLSGRYRLGRILGSGGMSVVYEAEDLRFARRVAVKLLKRPDSPELTERLFREARAAGRVNHPAIITVFEYGRDDENGLDYLVMELLEGEDLARRLARQVRLPLTTVLTLGLEIADGLAHAHDLGVVHRDLKPANVFLASRGRRVDEIKLLDFGLAKQLDLHTLTATGQAIGTAAYMAPEQIRGSKKVDARSDIYALGLLLWECATGAPPDRVETVEDLARRAMFEEEPAILESSRETPEAFRAIVRRCLRRRASERYPDARSVCSALLALQL